MKYKVLVASGRHPDVEELQKVEKLLEELSSIDSLKRAEITRKQILRGDKFVTVEYILSFKTDTCRIYLKTDGLAEVAERNWAWYLRIMIGDSSLKNKLKKIFDYLEQNYL